MEEKTKQKQGESGVQITWNAGRANDEKRSCGEVKNFQGCCLV